MTIKIFGKLSAYQNNRSFKKRVTLSPEIPEQIRNRVLAYKLELGKIARKNDCKLNFNPSGEQSVNMELLPAYRTYFDGYPMQTEYQVHSKTDMEISKDNSEGFVKGIVDFISEAMNKLGNKRNKFLYSPGNQYNVRTEFYGSDFLNSYGMRPY